jgi:hypothetical protein
LAEFRLGESVFIPPFAVQRYMLKTDRKVMNSKKTGRFDFKTA